MMYEHEHKDYYKGLEDLLKRADKAYQRNKADAYERGYKQGKADAELHWIPVEQGLPQIVKCKDCKYWNSGSCECREHAVNCQDYMVGDIETEAEHFCGYADRREVTI